MRDRIREAVSLLSANNIAVSHDELPSPGADAQILIQVTEMGDISHEHIKPFLLTLFPKEREARGVTAILHDVEHSKQFEIPYDLGECVDWFRIE